MEDKTARVGATVPDQLHYALKSILVAERITFTQWLITQMQRTLDEYAQVKGDDHLTEEVPYETRQNP